MDTPSVGVRQAEFDQADLQELRAQALNFVTLFLVAFVFMVLLLATVDPVIRQPRIWLIVVPILIAAFAGRIKRLGVPIASVFVVCLLGATIVGAGYAYSDLRMLYLLPLLVITANALLGEGLAAGIAFVSSLTVIALGEHGSPLETIQVSGIALLAIWTTAVLSAITSRPTRVALAWVWRSYALAERRTAELRERQAELGRLAKSLTETCERLERLNADFDRERRAAEEARRLKGEFAAAISHELRTPLNLIIGFSEMMISAPHAYGGHPLPEAYRQDLEAIHRNASHISRLIDDVLDLSQIDAHRLALEKSWAFLPEIVESAVQTVASFYQHLGLSLALETPPNLPALHVDVGRTRQILINLLNNAARFTERGGVTIRSFLEDGNIVLGVSDSGVGIAPADLPYVFDEFRQVGPRSSHRGGSGLGLAVCKRFAEMHGGFMWVESRVGEGSTFYLALPVGDPTIIIPVRREAPALPTSARRVAVLGRDMDTVRIFERYLDGYQVVPVRSLAEFRRRMKKEPLQALIQTDSATFARIGATNASHSDTCDLPVFSCTLKTRRVMAEELGVVQYLVKPVSRERLVATVRQCAKQNRDVLIVEDDPELARLFGNFIKTSSRHYHVRTVSTGNAALAEARERRPDVVILDLLLPELDGYGVLNELRADPTLQSVPVVVVSAKGLADEEIRASSLTLSRSNGLSVGETMRCLRGSLDALSDGRALDTSQALLAGSTQ